MIVVVSQLYSPLTGDHDLAARQRCHRPARQHAVIDFGDLTSGDPATDLSVAWMLLPAGERDVFRQAYGKADDHTWARARGWALSLSLVFMAFSADNPLMARIGQRTLLEVLM